MTFSASAVSVLPFFGAYFGVAGCGEMPNGTTDTTNLLGTMPIMTLERMNGESR